MTRLQLSEEQAAGRDDDSSIFADDTAPTKIRRDASLGKKLGRHLAQTKAKQLAQADEVVEAVSPGGHVSKRRARSRPVSLELLESVATAKNNNSVLAFPSLPRDTPPSPLAECSHSRRRVPGLNSTVSFSSVQSQSPVPASPSMRAPMARLESSATLFFGGPTISPAARPGMRSRHSYGGDTSIPSLGNTSVPDSKRSTGSGWTMRSPSKSPDSSPFSVVPEQRELRSLFDDDEDEEGFFSESSFSSTSIAGIPADSSFSDSSRFTMTVTEGTPPSRRISTASTGTLLPKKYKPRDSGIAISDDDDLFRLSSSLPSNPSLQQLHVMPRASTSVNTVSDAEDAAALITPGIEPDASSGWPVHVAGEFAMDVDMPDFSDDGGAHSAKVDGFIKRTLAAGGKASSGDGGGKKPVPGTPVKKAKKTIAGVRPWQSAVTNKVGLNFGVEPPGQNERKKGRKSLPAIFANAMASSPDGDEATDSEGEGEESPSLAGGRESRYTGVGLGRPSVKQSTSRMPWLMRRSSSGMISSGSESTLGTPTRTDKKTMRLSPLVKSRKFDKSSPSARSASSSSTSSIATLNSPTTHRGPHANAAPRAFTPIQHAFDSMQEPRSGRFEREFVQIDEIGSGQFGKVIKVRRRDGGNDGELSALKKSKRFDGSRHRLRVREEVDILEHLSIKASRTCGSTGGVARHPNVLAYLDSWEEDEVLYIQTELCDMGNFGNFLWEFGRSYAYLDEGRMWKVIVDLSSGLQFIHHAGVIHLDLKPANIFLTKEGRFKIGDFGMASLWPRRSTSAGADDNDIGSFEREGDKLYMAPEILQGRYGMAADIFSLGMTVLEAASNIVVPDQGESWHRLRQEDFSEVDCQGSPQLQALILSMMRTDPAERSGIDSVCQGRVVCRARDAMERGHVEAMRKGLPVFEASPLAVPEEGFLTHILGGDDLLD